MHKRLLKRGLCISLPKAPYTSPIGVYDPLGSKLKHKEGENPSVSNLSLNSTDASLLEVTPSILLQPQFRSLGTSACAPNPAKGLALQLHITTS